MLGLGGIDTVLLLDLLYDLIPLLHELLKSQILNISVMLPWDSKGKLKLSYLKFVFPELLLFRLYDLQKAIHLIFDELLKLIEEDAQLVVSFDEESDQSVHSHIERLFLLRFLFFDHIVFHSQLENDLVRLLFGGLELFRHLTSRCQFVVNYVFVVQDLVDLTL